MDPRAKTAIVVGGASGMARATAELLADRGATIAICDQPDSVGAEVASTIGADATFHPIDVTDFDATEQVIDDAVRAHGAVHICVNTAGGGLAQRTLTREGPHSLDDFRRIIDLNLVQTFNVCRLVARYMATNPPEDEERGVMINTSSIAAFEGQIGQVAYTAAKAGIAGMSLTMARDLGSLGIRVNAIAPSLFATGATARISPEREELLTKDNAFPRRMGRPEEYAKLVLAIVENPMLNGGCIRLDAGQRFGPR